MLLEGISEGGWLHTDVGHDNNIRLVLDVTESRHNAKRDVSSLDYSRTSMARTPVGP